MWIQGPAYNESRFIRHSPAIEVTLTSAVKAQPWFVARDVLSGDIHANRTVCPRPTREHKDCTYSAEHPKEVGGDGDLRYVRQ